MKYQRKSLSKVIFLNQPKLSEHLIDQKFNKLRIEFLPHIKDFILNHDRFKNKEVKITFSLKGVSSLVCIIETLDEKLVLKIPLSLVYSRGDSLFFSIWKQAGVNVPNIIEEGTINDYNYFLMDFIDAPKLSDIYSKAESVNHGVYFKMGSTLNAMHTPKTVGYGYVVDGKAEYLKFEDWINSPEVQEKAEYVKKHKLLDNSYGTFSSACKILIDFIGNDKASSYCHYDFGIHNIFSTDPYTVFDPDPHFNNGYIDLGRSLLYLIEKDLPLDSFIEGYFGSNQYDKKILHAAIFLGIYIRLQHAYETNKLDRIKNYKQYLYQNKQLLEN